LPAHGCPSGAAIEEAALGAIRDLVLPGFAHVGLEVAEAHEWLNQRVTEAMSIIV
jgi:hypothetical protein